MICIYLDEGVSQEGYLLLKKHFQRLGFLTSPIQSHEIIEGKLDRTDLLVLPGGRDLPYLKKLAGKGNENILSFLHQGGSYLGICAGAYYGTAEIEFEKGGCLEVLGDRELKFFSGKAIGPVYGKGRFLYNSQRGARAASIQFLDNPSPVYCYFNGGCYFADVKQAQNTKVLASYSDIACNPAAIIECSIGKGVAILSGVHFEYSASDLSPDKYIKTALPKIAATERERLLLFRNLLHRLRITQADESASARQ